MLRLRTTPEGRVPRLVYSLAALVVAPAFAAGATPPTAKKPLTAELMWQLARLGSPEISPDGKQAVIAVTNFDLKADKPLSDLWLIPTAGGDARQLTARGGPDSSPAWSPDGKWIAFLGKRVDDESPQLYAMPVDGGEPRRLTSVPAGALAPKWFPDSRRLAFATWVYPDWNGWSDQAKRAKEHKDSKITAQVYDKAPVRRWDRLLDERRPHLFSVALSGGEPTAITLGTELSLPFGSTTPDPERDDYDISPDGKEIAFTADSDRSGVEANYDVYTIAAEGGPARNVTAANPAGDFKPLYSPDGRTIAYQRQAIRRAYYDRARLAIYDRAARTGRVVTEAWDRSVSGMVWAPDGRSLIASIEDAGTRRVYRIELPFGRASSLTKDRSFSGLSLSRDGRIAVALREAFDEPPTLVRLDPRSGQATKLTNFNDTLLASVDLGAHESVTFAGADGAPIQMWITYPPGFDRSKKYPLYLLLHGGPHVGMTDVFFWRWNTQVFSGWGYVTAWHNFHGSSGFGEAFTSSIEPDWVTNPYQDTLAAARWFAQQSWIDPARMAAGGGSYGGYLASTLLGRAHPFQALVVHAGLSNFYAWYASDVGGQRKLFGEYWEDETLFHKISPHLEAAKFATPTLVIHGGLDYRVPVDQAFALFNVLQNRGVRSRLVYFPNENHFVLKPQNSLFWYEATRAWLKELVGEGPDGKPATTASH
jgi:dipeptidyl aminopeptidase/acylaminoacyl peptidase